MRGKVLNQSLYRLRRSSKFMVPGEKEGGKERERERERNLVVTGGS